MGVSILAVGVLYMGGTRAFHKVFFQTIVLGELETALLVCGEAQLVEYLPRQINIGCRVQASSHNAQSVIDKLVNEMSMSIRHQTGEQYSAAE